MVCGQSAEHNIGRIPRLMAVRVQIDGKGGLLLNKFNNSLILSHKILLWLHQLAGVGSKNESKPIFASSRFCYSPVGHFESGEFGAGRWIPSASFPGSRNLFGGHSTR